MSENQNTRRNFLKLMGLFAGTTLVSTKGLAGFVNQEEIKKLNPSQRDFMQKYGEWMDQFIEVIRIQKSDPDNMDNKHRAMSLSEEAEKLNTELAEYMKDDTFAMIYQASIKRMSDEIETKEG